MATPWNDLTLCTEADIAAEVVALDTPTLTAGAGWMTAVTAAMATAKDELRQQLQQRLPEIFVATAASYGYTGSYTSWFAESGYTYDQLDAVLDTIMNPQELKRVAVAYTLRALLVSRGFADVSSYDTNYTLIEPLHAMVTKMCKERFQLTVSLLKLDLSGDGTITDRERARAHKTIWRV